MSEASNGAIDLQISEDGQRAIIELTANDGHTAAVACDATSIDDVLAALSAVRALMADEIPHSLELPARIPVIRDARWCCETQGDQTLACFRHPGFGWLGFGLAADEAKSLAARLQESRKS